MFFGSKRMEMAKRGAREETTLLPASLCDLCPDETGVVEETLWRTEHAALLESYGFYPGCPVTRVGSAPQGDPVIYRLEGRLVAVRKETAAKITVRRAKK